MRPDQRASIIALTSPYSGVGTSHVARSLSLLAAAYYQPQGFRVCLIDYDVDQQAQSAFFTEPSHQTEYGALAGPFDATFGQSPFWQVSPSVVDDQGQRMRAGAYGGMYLIGDSGLAITRFDWTKVRSGQTVHVRDVPDYWDTLRDQFALIIVDTPAFDRGDTSLSLFPVADQTVIISDAHRTREAAISDLSQNITDHGGQCAGLIQNHGPATALPKTGNSAPF